MVDSDLRVEAGRYRIVVFEDFSANDNLSLCIIGFHSRNTFWDFVVVVAEVRAGVLVASAALKSSSR